MIRILLVDDSPVDRKLFSGLLQRKAAFKVQLAENGADALDYLEHQEVDIVLTDMQMPEMDGLELVDAIKQKYPQLPVILLTGHGSEELATKALQTGAAGYVPKSKTADLLVETVNHVLEMKKPDLNLDQVFENGGAELNVVVESRFAKIKPLVALVHRIVAGKRNLNPNEALQVAVAVEHALMNALVHGNWKLSRENAKLGLTNDIIAKAEADESLVKKRIGLSFRMDEKEIRIGVSDEGSGFDVREYHDVGLSMAKSDRGQGLFLMWTFMHRVAFNKVGNQVVMTRARMAPVSSKSAPAAPKPLENLGVLIAKNGSRIPISKRRLIVGRDVSSDIRLENESVSLHHCVMFVHEGWWFVKDLRSRNGIRVNGAPTGKHRLNPGAILTIGRCEFEIDYVPYDLGAEGLTPPIDPF